jgi:hypothetical protein
MIKSSLVVCALLFTLLSGCQSVTEPSTSASNPAAAAPSVNTVTCSLQQSGDEFKGTCDIPCMVNALAIDIDGPNPKISCNTPPRQVTAMLRKTGKGDNWLGTMEGKFPEDPTRFELMNGRDGAAGVAKLPYGWFRLQSAQLNGGTFGVTISADKQLPPTTDDIKIIQRAGALVANVNVWNKNDNRTCLPNPQKWSVFCALTQATEEISGGVHYRQPALQAVREVVNEVGGTRVGKHRLMDYNNHPDTTLDDINNLLRMAQTRLEKRFR